MATKSWTKDEIIDFIKRLIDVKVGEKSYYHTRCMEMLYKFINLIHNLELIDQKDDSYHSRRAKIFELADDIYSLMAEIMTRYR